MDFTQSPPSRDPRMSAFCPPQTQSAYLYYQESEGAPVVGPLSGLINITTSTTAAELRTMIVQDRLGAHHSLPRCVAELPFRFVAVECISGVSLDRVVELTQERNLAVLGPKFAYKGDVGEWRVALRGYGLLQPGVLDPGQTETLRGELVRLRGDVEGKSSGAGIIDAIADILEDNHVERNEQGKVYNMTGRSKVGCV